MCDHDCNTAAGAHTQNRDGQRRIPRRIKIRIRLVEHDKERIAIERARERNALPLTGRERTALLADLRVISVGQRMRS